MRSMALFTMLDGTWISGLAHTLLRDAGIGHQHRKAAPEGTALRLENGG